MLENPAPFLLNFFPLMKYSSKERSSHIAPSHQSHTPNQKNPPENVGTLPNNH